MTTIAGGVLLGFGMLLSFGDAFALGPWLPLPLLWMLASVPVVVWGLVIAGPTARAPGLVTSADAVLFALVLALLAGEVLAPRFQQKNFNHILAFATTCGLFFAYVKLLLVLGSEPERLASRLRAGVAVSVALVAAYACFEFLDVNLLHTGIVAYVRISAGGPDFRPVFLDWVRVRGFENEPGLLALFLNVVAPFSLVHVWRRFGRSAALALLAPVAVAWTATFSVGGMVSLAVGVAAAGAVALRNRLTVRRLGLALAVVALAVTVGVTVPRTYVGRIVGKITLSDVSSGQERAERWRQAIAEFPERPVLGEGLGATSAERGTGVISLYLLLLKEGGVVGLGLFVGFLAVVFARVLRMPDGHPYRYPYLIGLVAGAAHYALLSDFWYPWLWTLCALILADRSEVPAP